MPTYEYRCAKCGHQFEHSQGIKDAPLRRCPKCGGKINRVISGGGFLFKGRAPIPKFSGQTSGDASSCCGITNPCSDPKRCCGR
jgi:putative FmdB family regulatory protein